MSPNTPPPNLFFTSFYSFSTSWILKFHFHRPALQIPPIPLFALILSFSILSLIFLFSDSPKFTSFHTSFPLLIVSFFFLIILSTPSSPLVILHPLTPSSKYRPSSEQHNDNFSLSTIAEGSHPNVRKLCDTPPNVPHARALAYYDNIICQVTWFSPLSLTPFSASPPKSCPGPWLSSKCMGMSIHRYSKVWNAKGGGWKWS